jgi:hypothetical protein
VNVQIQVSNMLDERLPKNCLSMMLSLVISQTVQLRIAVSRALEQSVDTIYLVGMWWWIMP